MNDEERLRNAITITQEEFRHLHRDALECHEVSEDERAGDCYALALARFALAVLDRKDLDGQDLVDAGLAAAFRESSDKEAR